MSNERQKRTWKARKGRWSKVENPGKMLER